MTGRTEPPTERKPRAPAPAALERPTHLADGRWLGDFPKISPAERALVACCARGEVWTPKGWDRTRPEAKSAANTIRAGLIRFLALGGDAAHPVHESGVMLQGGWIEDKLDLHQCRLPLRLDLKFCRFVAIPVFTAASLPELALSGSLVPGLRADRVHVVGGLFLREGFSATGAVRLLGAEIGSNIECWGGSFANPGSDALSADRVVVKGGVFLNEGFSATGAVRLLGAEIGGNVECQGGSFTNPGSAALFADGVVVKGDVFLNKGFSATGAVRLPGAQIGGDLACNEGSFDNQGESALSADAAVIKGGLFLRRMKSKGALSLSAVRVGTLLDDRKCWIGGGHLLDGLSYDRIIGPTDAPSRIAWLHSQRDSHLATDFRPQPWEQLIKVLREMGHPHEARAIAIEKQRAMRRAGIYGLPPTKTPFDRSLGVGHNLRALGERAAQPFRHPLCLLDGMRHRLFGALSGYGHRPWRILAWVTILWLGFTALYWGFGVGCPNFTGCSGNLVASVLYSLDALLPVDFGMVKGSLPVDALGVPDSTDFPVRSLSVIETLIGWIFGVLVLAIVGNLVRKD